MITGKARGALQTEERESQAAWASPPLRSATDLCLAYKTWKQMVFFFFLNHHSFAIRFGLKFEILASLEKRI